MEWANFFLFCRVNCKFEIVAGVLFSQLALKDIFAALKFPTRA